MALVELPGLGNRDPHQVQFVQRHPQRADRALEDRGVGQVEDIPFGLEGLAGALGLFAAALGEIDIGPAGKAVLLVPRTLAVAQKHQFVHEKTPLGMLSIEIVRNTSVHSTVSGRHAPSSGAMASFGDPGPGTDAGLAPGSPPRRHLNLVVCAASLGRGGERRGGGYHCGLIGAIMVVPAGHCLRGIPHPSTLQE